MIEGDFKVLQSEFKKKNPQIREVSQALVSSQDVLTQA